MLVDQNQINKQAPITLLPWVPGKVHSGPSSSFESKANDEMQMRDKIHKTQDLQDLQDLITAEDNCGPVGLEPEDSVN